MKTFIIAILILSFTSAFSQKTGYWIVVSENRKTEVIKTKSIVEAYTIMELHFPGNCIDIEKELSKSVPVLEVRNGKSQVYIEKKRINKKGKYRRIRK